MFDEIRRFHDTAEPDGSPVSETRDDQLAKLQDQERLWFSWLTVLHERLAKTRPSDAIAAEGRKVLEVARRRWLAAKQALQDHRSRA